MSQPDIRPADDDDDDEDDDDGAVGDGRRRGGVDSSVSQRLSSGSSSRGRGRLAEDPASFSSPDLMKRKKKAETIAKDSLLVGGSSWVYWELF